MPSPLDYITRWFSTPSAPSVAEEATAALEAARQRVDAELAKAKAEAARAADEAQANQCIQDTFSSATPKDELVYISTSDNAPKELAALKRGGAKLTSPARTDDAKRDACLTQAQEAKLTDNAKSFAPTFAAAEHGARKIPRLAISGHGGYNGPFVLGIDDARSLAAVYPDAAKQVEHLMLASCHSNHPASFQEWKKIFPNLKTLSGFDRSAPSGALAATQVQQWELSTRRGSVVGLDPEVATWTLSRGYRGTQPAESFGNLEAQETLAANHGVYHRYKEGLTPLANATNDAELNAYYALLQRLVGHPDASEWTRGYYKDKADEVLRWRHPEMFAGR